MAKKDHALEERQERIVGRRARKAVARAKNEAEALGLDWQDMRKLRRAFGIPGPHPESKRSWVALAKKHSVEVLGVSSPKAIDWDKIAEFIERVLPLIIKAFAGC